MFLADYNCSGNDLKTETTIPSIFWSKLQFGTRTFFIAFINTSRLKRTFRLWPSLSLTILASFKFGVIVERRYLNSWRICWSVKVSKICTFSAVTYPPCFPHSIALLAINWFCFSFALCLTSEAACFIVSTVELNSSSKALAFFYLFFIWERNFFLLHLIGPSMNPD